MDRPPHQASQLLCAWNAFALQTLGDQLVEAGYQADPRTVGYLPPVTAEQAAAFLGEVEHCYRLGQLLAMPALLERPDITATPVSGRSFRCPGSRASTRGA